MARARPDVSRMISSGHLRDRSWRVLRDPRPWLERERETPTAQETPMSAKQKRWSEMTAAELAAATRDFDEPGFNPPAQKPSGRQLAELRRIQGKAKDRFRIALSLEPDLIEQADEYAADHGITFSQLVADALRRLL